MPAERVKRIGGLLKMKLTKSKLKQIIKEELNDIVEQGEEPGGAGSEWPAHLESGPWVTGVKQILAAASRLYEDMPLEGKEAITDYFEWYAKRWREQMREETGDRPSWMGQE